MISIGIDPSTKSTGFVVLEATEPVLVPKVLHFSASKHPDLKGQPRQSAIASDMIDLLNKYRPERVMIEGYGLNFKHSSSVVPLVELGGLLRYFLVQYEYDFFAPVPGSLKKFVTGSGAGTGKAVKKKVMKAIATRWGFETKVDDIADAYALAFMGLAQGGVIKGLTSDEREILFGMPLTRACNQLHTA